LRDGAKRSFLPAPSFFIGIAGAGTEHMSNKISKKPAAQPTPSGDLAAELEHVGTHDGEATRLGASRAPIELDDVDFGTILALNDRARFSCTVSD
jgi:hypothetical protein